MKLVARSNGVWMLEYREGKRRVRISTGERIKERAEEVAKRILAGHHERSQTWTLEDALLDTFDRIWSKQKSAEPCRLRMGKLIKAEGRTRIADMTYDYLVQLGERMLKDWGAKPATVNRYMSMISKALTEASMRGKLEARPKIPYYREPKGKLRWISREEEQLLLEKCEELWKGPDCRAMRALIVFLVDTGARLSEALGVAGTAVPGARQVEFVDTKNEGSRSVPLTPRAADAWFELPHWTNKLAVDRFTRLRNLCGLPDVSLHTLRHTCASRLVQGGMDLYRVMHWLGHSSINVTQRYAHLAPTSLAHGAEILAHGGHWTPIGPDSSRKVPAVPRLKLVK